MNDLRSQLDEASDQLASAKSGLKVATSDLASAKVCHNSKAHACISPLARQSKVEELSQVREELEKKLVRRDVAEK